MGQIWDRIAARRSAPVTTAPWLPTRPVANRESTMTHHPLIALATFGIALATILGVLAVCFGTRPAPAESNGTVKLRMPDIVQDTPYGCTPASASMVLATYGQQISQDSLAVEMDTTDQGTDPNLAITLMTRIVPSLRPRSVASPTALRAVLVAAVRAGHAVLVGVVIPRLPWYQGRPNSDHDIVVDGYTPTTLTVWDPIPTLGGARTITAAALFKAMAPGDILLTSN